MDEAAATARLQRMTAYDVDPTLTPAEITALLEQFRVPDSSGALPSDADWEGAYDLNAAAAEGWTWKAGKCSNRFAFSSDVNSFDRQQTFEHCERMAQQYRNRASRSLQSGEDNIYNPVIGNLGP